MRFTFNVSTGDLESGAANPTLFAVTISELNASDYDLVPDVAEMLHVGYCAKYPPSQRDAGKELTLIAVTGGLEDESVGDDFVVGYHDGHEWQQLIDWDSSEPYLGQAW
jgi:hypothetical protein